MSRVYQCDGCDVDVSAGKDDHDQWLRLRSSLHGKPNKVLADIDLCQNCKGKFAVALRKILRKDVQT